MTRDELNRRRMMFQINAKKNNLLKPEYEVQNPNVLRHSATNDYLEFRKKVAQGAKMQKEAKVNLFNVTEANEQYRQELADKTILVHTGAGGITNAYVAKLDDFYGPGKPRYFYTKEEWEGYQRNKQGASQAGAQRGAKEGADAKNKNLATSAADAYTKSKANEVKQQIKESFNKLTGKNKPDLVGGREAAEKAGQKTMQDLQKATNIANDKERWGKYRESEAGKQVGKNLFATTFKDFKNPEDMLNYPGGPEKFADDFEEALKKGITEYEKNAAGAKNAGADRAAKDSAEANAQKEEKDQAKKKAEEEYNKNAQAAENAGADRAAKDSKAANDQKADKINKKNWERNAGQKWHADRDRAEKEYINNATNPDDPKLNKLADSFTDNGWKAKSKKMNLIIDKQNKNGMSYSVESAKKKAKHDGLEDGITTDAMTPEKEYLNFRTKVEAGLKHFGQTRGLISIPINQALKNGESLAHASYGGSGMTNKYYAKIDDFWGKGKPRYFYSKEEWDGYQKNKQGAGQAGADRAAKQKEETSKIESKSYSDKKIESDLKNKSLAEKADNAYQKVSRTDLLNKAQSGREAAIKNSESLIDEKKLKRQKLLEANQSEREASEKDATKRTMATIAYDKALKEYNPVATEVNKKYGFDKMGPEDKEARVKALTKVIKDVNKVISKDEIDNPNNVKFDSSYDDNSASYDIYIPEYKDKIDLLYNQYNEFKNEYAKTLQNAQAMHDFDAIKEANQRAEELFGIMTALQANINEMKKEQDSKVLPYMTEVYKELLK